jgi:sec-independent protein translocase protein TatA
MGMGVIEPWHLVLILIIALVIFGPRKLGDIGGSIGRGIREFKTSINGDDDERPPEKPAEAAATAKGTAETDGSDRAP